MNSHKKKLSSTQRDELFQILEERFQKHMSRHENITWDERKDKLTQR